ncbi:MAG TPA: VOC family protein [Flavitalea sp.]|nr:VOC family protein [Flavitalea sp.]
MQKIVPHLWFDKEAKDAAAFYVSVFGNESKLDNNFTLHDTPSGSVDVVGFHVLGYEFAAISAGPLFKFNPSVSFSVACKSTAEVDALWEKLSSGGKALMELGTYPFSERYGWLEDRYGLSWQLIAMGDVEIKQRVTPAIMFVGDVCGKAEEAIRFYASVFRNSKVGDIFRYVKGQEPDKEGAAAHAFFTLENQEFVAMDSARSHHFAFNEAISFIVNCNTQQEINYYWEKLSADPKSEQCGWLKDQYGLSWQVGPANMNDMLQNGTPEQVDRVTKAFLKMKKFDLAVLEDAYRG